MSPRIFIRISLQLCFLGAISLRGAEDPLAFFESRIRPLLAKHCYQCHSAARGETRAGLALDHRDGLLTGGDSGPAIIPGQPDNSLLLRAVRQTDPKLKMPAKGERLSDAEMTALEQWIAMGAPDPRDAPPTGTSQPHNPDWKHARQHWAFHPLKKAEVPEAAHTNPIDAFIFARMRTAGIAPAEITDRNTWMRRVTFSLTGLPPSVRELTAFTDDTRPDHTARTAVIDRLLASEQYGVHWARHWLDIVRFGETSGAPGQFPIADAWKYRDYVVDAFNRDKTYPRFVREQIAGDLLPFESPEQRREQLIATGYLALARRFENTAIMKHLVIEDVLDTTGQAILGLSLSCARCHDHKFDPIPTADYYALYGIFESTAFPFPGKEHMKAPAGLTVIGDDTRSREVATLYDELDGLVRDYNRGYHLRGAIRSEYDILRANQRRTPRQEARFRELEQLSDEARSLTGDKKKRIEAIRKKFPDESAVDSIYAVRDAAPVNTRIQRRGEVYNLADEVPRGFLRVLGHAELPSDTRGSGRRELADWLVSTNNPLTARVIVNRVWHWHFGRGLVTTPNDFGTRGKPPTHPELLDFLAARFVKAGWSFKALHRLILSSDTFALGGDNQAAVIADPENRYYARFNRRRLTAEEIRDSLLFVSGRLDPRLGGSHGAFVRPVRSRSYSQGGPFRPSYPELDQRRSLYLFQHRSKPHPFLAIFDGADTATTTPVRGESNTALQGLFFLNAPLFHDCADHLTRRLLQTQSDPRRRLELATRLVFSREPTPAERSLTHRLLQQPSDKTSAWQSVSRLLLASNAMIFID